MTYTAAKDPKVVFAEVKRSLALVERAGRIELRFCSTEATELTQANPGEGAVRLDVGLIAAEGQEVTSGTYVKADHPPMVLDARLAGGIKPAAEAGEGIEIAVIDEGEGGAEGLVWTGSEVKVEVVARTKTKICGRFHFKDSNHEARGEFNLDIP